MLTCIIHKLQRQVMSILAFFISYFAWVFIQMLSSVFPWSPGPECIEQFTCRDGFSLLICSEHYKFCKNNACVLLWPILSVINPDWLHVVDAKCMNAFLCVCVCKNCIHTLCVEEWKGFNFWAKRSFFFNDSILISMILTPHGCVINQTPFWLSHNARNTPFSAIFVIDNPTCVNCCEWMRTQHFHMICWVTSGNIRGGGTHIFGQMGMCRSNGSFFTKKSLNMGPVFYQKIL